MAHSVSARKRARQAARRRTHNAAIRSMYRTRIKKVLHAIREGNRDEARKAYLDAKSMIDRVADKGLIHKNKAARHKSRLNQRIQEMA